MAMFKGFKPQGMQKIANKMGYQGAMENFDNYLEQNPDKQREMLVYQDTARKMATGGFTPGDQKKIDLQGGQAQPRQLSQSYVPQQQSAVGKKIGQVTAERMQTPGLPTGARVTPVGTKVEAQQIVDPNAGQVSGDIVVDPTIARTAQATEPSADKDANVAGVVTKTEEVGTALDATQAAQTDPNDPRAKVIAAQQTTSAVSDLDAAQGNITKMENPVQREIQQGEIIDGVANAEKASKFTEQIQAAETNPSEKATVQGQLATLTQNFDATNPPAWAAGALRGVQAAMAQRGLGASSMAGQAMIQAAIESALPIAQMDAKTQAQFEGQNLSNRQQRAMLAAQQRATFIGQEFDQAFQARVQNASKIADIANMNFTSEQQIALENSRIANTMELSNLSNKQAMVMAEASALANMDMANLNNRQQSQVQNAQNFLQMDMANLSNRQQTELFKSQQKIQSLFTDTAAENARRQFNATSENQVDQFFANLSSQTNQYNATQLNTQSQFNAGQSNVVERFNAELNNQRDQFNASNQLVIAQSNAQWRRQVATADTTAINRANELNAQNLLGISNQAYNNLWQYYGDTMEWAWKSSENERERVKDLTAAQINASAATDAAKIKGDYESSSSIGGVVLPILFKKFLGM